MKEQAITNFAEGFAELHMEYLKTGKGYSVVAHLSEFESKQKGDWRALAATEVTVLSAVCKRILDELAKND